jgi:hypothetical protein
VARTGVLGAEARLDFANNFGGVAANLSLLHGAAVFRVTAHRSGRSHATKGLVVTDRAALAAQSASVEFECHEDFVGHFVIAPDSKP